MRRWNKLGGVGRTVLAAALWSCSRAPRPPEGFSDAIRTVGDTIPAQVAWIETFESDSTQPLARYDTAWHPIFGDLLVDQQLDAVVGDPDGGWTRDGGDDYSFRQPQGGALDQRIVLDGWWDGHGSMGAQASVQRDAPHRLYEATLWRGKLALIYFSGPTPDRFEVLAESREPPRARGFYRLLFCQKRTNGRWDLRALLLDPAAGNAVVAGVAASDDRLPPGGHGIGILGPGGPRGSYITSFALITPKPGGASGRGDVFPAAGCGVQGQR